MSNPYTQPTLTGYNSNPPADDGTQTAANQVSWAKHKTKLGDPLKTFAQAVDSNVATAFGKAFGAAVTEQSTNYTVQTSDQGAFIACTATLTVTLPAAATAGSGFPLCVLNRSSAGVVTVDGNGAETINGSTTITLNAGESAILTCDGASWFASIVRPTTLPRSYLAGLTLSNDTDADHDIAIAAGECRDDGDAADLVLSATLTKQIDAAWAVGDDQGGLDTGSVTTATWYHVFLIRRSDTGVVDALFSTSRASPTMPTNYDQKRRIGAVRTDGSSNIFGFVQRGDEFRYKDLSAVSTDYSTTIGSTAVSITTKCPPLTNGLFNTHARVAGEAVHVYISPLDVDDEASSLSASPLSSINAETNITGATVDINSTGAQIQCWVNASSALRAVAGVSNTTLRLQTLGWTDRRGRDD